MTSYTPFSIRLSELDFGDEEVQRVVEVLESQEFFMGPVVNEFEEAFAEYLGAGHAIAVSSATAALHLAHHAHGIGPGDEVIVPALTFVATSNSVLYTGATPVFADVVGLHDFNIDPEDIERKITPQTRGITVVHYAGYGANMDAIQAIAEKHNLYIVEDAAHAPGAMYHDKKLGTIGAAGCFSFFPNKNMTTAEGGMVVTNDDQLAESIRRARSHCMSTVTWDRVRGHAHSYDVVDLGFNYRLDEIRAAIGLVQLKKLTHNNQRRKELMEKYLTGLGQCSMIEFPFESAPDRGSYHICPLLLAGGINRAAFMAGMKEQGIQTSIHYPPIHLFTYYRKRFGYRDGLLPITEEIGQREVTLPLYPKMSEDDVIQVVETVLDTLAGLKSQEEA